MHDSGITINNDINTSGAYHQNSIEQEIAEVNEFVKRLRSALITQEDKRLLHTMQDCFEYIQKTNLLDQPILPEQITVTLRSL